VSPVDRPETGAASTRKPELTESGPGGSGPWKLQFRAEMYNIFNIPFLTTQSDAWRTVSSSSSFGTVNAAGNARKMQLGLKLSW
jgi:hypothetical protein